MGEAAGPTRGIDLNSDLGESFGLYTLGHDEALLDAITSANIACGFHAGDPRVMRRTVALALEKGVGIGAHPSLPDLPGFGRREMAVSAEEVETDVLYQLGALAGFARAAGAAVRHVKPHGALYNMIARDETLARAVAEAVARFDPALILVGLPGSAVERAAAAVGLPFAREAFADRAYTPEGSLASRRLPGALVTDPAEVARRAVRMAREGLVTAIDGSDIALVPDTICIHGDTPGAVELARTVREALAAAGITVRALAGAAGLAA